MVERNITLFTFDDSSHMSFERILLIYFWKRCAHISYKSQAPMRHMKAGFKALTWSVCVPYTIFFLIYCCATEPSNAYITCRPLQIANIYRRICDEKLDQSSSKNINVISPLFFRYRRAFG